MTYRIRSLVSADVETVVEFGLRAWRPVFESFEKALGSTIYQRVYPDWLGSQARAIEASCLSESSHVWVSEHDGRPVGFVVVLFHDDTPEGSPQRGEIDMLGVDPDHQGAGIGTALTVHAAEYIKDAGCEMVELVTGGDPGHAPARATYEKAGFSALPLVRYYKAV